MAKNNKVAVKKETVEDILEELSYSWATPEAQEFQYRMKEKKYPSAKSMLVKEGLNKEQVKMVMDYFKSKMNQKKKLIEYCSFEYDNLQDGDKIVVSYGGAMISSVVKNNKKHTEHKGNCFFDGMNGYVLLSDATQVWKVEKV